MKRNGGMRELTKDEERMLDLIPQEVFMSYMATRLGETKQSQRSCGHWKEYYPYCKTCYRTEIAATKLAEKLAQEFGKEPNEMRNYLQQLHRQWERSDGDLDYPAHVLSALQTNRKKAVQLIRVFGLELK